MADIGQEHRERKIPRFLIAYGLAVFAVIAVGMYYRDQPQAMRPEDLAYFATQDAHVAATAVALEDPTVLQAEMDDLPEPLKESAVRLIMTKMDENGVRVQSQCSGTVIQNSDRVVIVTAGHCLNEDAGMLIEVGVSQPHRGSQDQSLISNKFDIAIDSKKDIGVMVINDAHISNISENPIQVDTSWNRDDDPYLSVLSYPGPALEGVGYQVSSMHLDQDATLRRGLVSESVVADSVSGPGASGSGMSHHDRLVAVLKGSNRDGVVFMIIGNTVEKLLEKIENGN